MNAGNFRDPITIKTPSYSRNAYGESIKTYSTSVSDWAELESVVADERFMNDVKRVVDSKVFKIREGNTINEDSIITHDSRDYAVLAVDRINIGGYLRVTCEAYKDLS